MERRGKGGGSISPFISAGPAQLLGDEIRFSPWLRWRAALPSKCNGISGGDSGDGRNGGIFDGVLLVSIRGWSRRIKQKPGQSSCCFPTPVFLSLLGPGCSSDEPHFLLALIHALGAAILVITIFVIRGLHAEQHIAEWASSLGRCPWRSPWRGSGCRPG